MTKDGATAKKFRKIDKARETPDIMAANVCRLAVDGWACGMQIGARREARDRS
jgi:hypothetical protein